MRETCRPSHHPNSEALSIEANPRLPPSPSALLRECKFGRVVGLVGRWSDGMGQWCDGAMGQWGGEFREGGGMKQSRQAIQAVPPGGDCLQGVTICSVMFGTFFC